MCDLMIFSVGMIYFSGEFNGLSRVVLVIYENKYVDIKYGYYLLKKLLVVSHAHITRFDMAFTFTKFY